MRKYRIVGTYHVELEVETALVGQELFNFYSDMLNTPETKQKACLTHGDRLFICKCGMGYARSASKFCSNCGTKHVFDEKVGVIK